MRVKYAACRLTCPQVHVKGHADIALVADEHLSVVVHHHLRTEDSARAVYAAHPESAVFFRCGVRAVVKNHVADEPEVPPDNAVALFAGDEGGLFGDVAVEFILDLELDHIVLAVVNPDTVFPSAALSGVLLVEVSHIDVVEVQTSDKIFAVVSVLVVPHEAQRTTAKLEILGVGDAVLQLVTQPVCFVAQKLSPAFDCRLIALEIIAV